MVYNMIENSLQLFNLSSSPPQQTLASALLNRNYDKPRVILQCYVTL